ncbi:hypothetical protein K488DRAFT_46089 [Vararia minispora EC-137]|uniref:Uncharacterized protein n=1 Tax=Vararia minispora EC-137 TaxID=1314806 RepID=A0ACB8QRI3_9AGAM|nr:hypothetical protein K488DRAFT_46089 [Vararia minispora EC-137]
MTAVSSPAAAVFTTAFLSGVSSITSILIIYLDIYGTRIRTPWARITLFPAIWATAWQLVARFSPVGHLMTWTPTQGIDAYVWMRPYFGPWGVNWIVGSLAVIVTDVVGTWFIGTDSVSAVTDTMGQAVPDADLLGLHDSPEYVVVEQYTVRRGGGHILSLTTIVLALGIPSYFFKPTPLPTHPESSTALVAGCMLPPPPRQGDPSSTFDRFLSETKHHVSDAKVDILLWPEGAVRFDNADDRLKKLEMVQNVTGGSFVGVTFEEPAPEDVPGHRPGTRRNGMALVGPHGVVFEYYKRNLVPFVESFPLSSSDEIPTIYEVEIPITKSGKTTRAIPITASICLDFASPRVLDALPSRPALVLAPARTWHRDVSLAMWEQARARAEEIGSRVLFCDGGEDGVSGFAGHGMREVYQVGPGSWTRAIGIEHPLRTSKTPYAEGGDWTMACLVFAMLGVGWFGEIAVAQLVSKYGKLLVGDRGGLRQVLAIVQGKFHSITGRHQQGRRPEGEQQPLLA